VCAGIRVFEKKVAKGQGEVEYRIMQVPLAHLPNSLPPTEAIISPVYCV
jgi:hypothetical protein